MSRKLAVFLEVGYTGTGTVEFIEIDDTMTEEQLDALVWDMAADHAAMYGYYPEEDMPDDFDEENEDADQYSSNIEGYYEEYDSVQHDGYTRTGESPSFQKLY